MRNYEKIMKESERLQKTICNRCGKEIPVADGCETEGVFHVDYKWGYFSRKDGERHKFDLCESCYDSLLEQFCIPAEIEG